MERRVEWLTLGLVVVLFGVALLSNSEIVQQIVFPLLGGGILMLSAIIQKIGRNWNVSLFTWILAVLLLAAGLTSTIGFYTPDPDDVFNFTYFWGSVIVLGGVAILLQIFRRG